MMTVAHVIIQTDTHEAGPESTLWRCWFSGPSKVTLYPSLGVLFQDCCHSLGGLVMNWGPQGLCLQSG